MDKFQLIVANIIAIMISFLCAIVGLCVVLKGNIGEASLLIGVSYFIVAYLYLLNCYMEKLIVL